MAEKMVPQGPPFFWLFDSKLLVVQLCSTVYRPKKNMDQFFSSFLSNSCKKIKIRDINVNLLKFNTKSLYIIFNMISALYGKEYSQLFFVEMG